MPLGYKLEDGKLSIVVAKMVAECETLLQAVRQGTEQIRSELREKVVEFATVMREYSERIAAKNAAYVESTRNTIDVISSHIETVRAAMKGGRA